MKNVNKLIWAGIFMLALIFMMLTVLFTAFDDYTATLNIQSKARVFYGITLALNLYLIFSLRLEFVRSVKLFLILLFFPIFFSLGYIIFKDAVYAEGLRLRVACLRGENEKLLNQSRQADKSGSQPLKINWLSLGGGRQIEAYMLDDEVFLCLISTTKARDEYLIYSLKPVSDIKCVLENWFKGGDIALRKCVSGWYWLLIDR